MQVDKSRITDTSESLPVRTPLRWIPEGADDGLSPQEKAEDGKLLAQLSADCVESYFWTEETFQAEIAKRKGRSVRTFHAQRGSFWWRPFALVFLPVNYAVIACVFVLLGELLVLEIATFVSMFTATFPYWFVDYLYSSATVLYYTACTAGYFGLWIAIFMALFPRLASARGFGYVAENGSTAMLIFCGSKFSDNLTINALVWPWYKPFRHAGFQRAWSHIRGEVVEWLETALPDGGEIILTGHSLGGALAQIAAYELPDLVAKEAADRYRIRNVVSFGSSRIGGREMRKLYMYSAAKPDLPTRTRHITHANDAVPRLPPPLFYKHVGRGVIVYPDGDLVERNAEPLWRSFWKISKGVQKIWKGRTVEQVLDHHGTLAPKAYSETAEFLKLAKFFSFFRGLPSPGAAPLATALFYVVAAHLFYFRAFKTGFGDHRRRYYRDTLAARLIEINDTGAVNYSEYSGRRRRLSYSYWNDSVYCQIDESDGSFFWFTDEVFFRWRGDLEMIGSAKEIGKSPDSAKAKADALSGLRIVVRCALREQEIIRRSRRELIDLNDGQYTDDAQLKKSKVREFQRWLTEHSFRWLGKEEEEKAKAEYLSRGFNIEHFLVAWSAGQDLFIERVKGNKSWIWRYPYDGSYDEALERVKKLLQAPLVDPASPPAIWASLATLGPASAVTGLSLAALGLGIPAGPAAGLSLATRLSGAIPSRQLVCLTDGHMIRGPLVFGRPLDNIETPVDMDKYQAFMSWRNGRGTANLSRETCDEIDARAKSSGLNTDQIVSIWTEGEDLFIERFADDKFSMMPYPYSGCRQEALRQAKRLIQAPFTDLGGPRGDLPASEVALVVPAPVKPTSK
jgi:pimeloyl-ACP methyl ester carboxylesterase